MLTTPATSPVTSIARRVTLVLAAVGLAITAPSAIATADGEAMQVREPHRPHSADAAERWWASCVADLPHSADAAERAAADCW